MQNFYCLTRLLMRNSLNIKKSTFTAGDKFGKTDIVFSNRASTCDFGPGTFKSYKCRVKRSILREDCQSLSNFYPLNLYLSFQNFVKMKKVHNSNLTSKNF